MRSKISIGWVLSMLVICGSCSQKYNKESKDIVAGLTIDQKIGQMMMVGVAGVSINDATKKMLATYKPGGIILFGYNLGARHELHSFINTMQITVCNDSQVPLFISIDQEGGRVRRIIDGVTQFPGNMAMGSANDKDLVYDAAFCLALQLRALGINMNLAPDVDVNNNPDNPVINTRSFGSDPGIVAELGRMYIKGLQKGRCIAVAKHFPGHGDTNKDSHKTLPVIPYTLDRLKKVEFVPFKKAVETGVEGVMSAHISYPAVLGNDRPATLSRRFLDTILRQQMGFKGVVISDDLEMNAIAGNMTIGEAAVKAVKAGIDILLISTHGNNIEAIHTSLKEALLRGELLESDIDHIVQRIIEIKLRYNIINKREDGSLVLGKPAVEHSDHEFLARADDINRKISEKALYFYQPASGARAFAKPDSASGLIVTDNRTLQQAAASLGPDWQVSDETAYQKSIENYLRTHDDGKLLHVYYTLDRMGAVYTSLQSLQKKYHFNLLLVSLHNPFTISGMRLSDPVLFTFSPTTASVAAVVRAMKGEIVPKNTVTINMGFGRNH